MKARALVGIIPFIVLLFMVAASLSAETYYVDGTNGSDSYNGLFATYQGGSDGPWKTLTYANNTVPSGTNTVNVAAGTYDEAITISTSGTDQNDPLHWLAHGVVDITEMVTITGSYVTFEGFTVSKPTGNGSGTIRIAGAYDMILSCDVINSADYGIDLVSSSSNSTVDKCVINNAKSTGIEVGGTDNLVENNDISHTEKGTLWDANGMNVEVDDGETVSTGNVIKGNYIHDILYTDGNNSGVHIDGIQCNYYGTYATNITIEDNHIYMWQEAQSATATSSGFMIAGADNWVIKNNIVEAWQGYGTGGSGTPENIKIYNNLFRSNLAWTNEYFGAGVDIVGGSGDDVENNIFVDFLAMPRESHAIILENNPSVTIHNNLFWNSDGSKPAFSGFTPDSTNLIGVNPDFVSDFSDLHLQAGSPAIDAGATLSDVTEDYDGVARPQGAGYDIGPYEYVATPPPAAPSGLRVIP